MVVIGLPIHGWSVENMLKIGEVWRRVIESENVDGSHYNSFWMLVETNTGPMVQAYVDVVIDGDTFRVFVRETGDRNIHRQNSKPLMVDNPPTVMVAIQSELGDTRLAEGRKETVGGSTNASYDVEGGGGDKELEESWVGETRQTRWNKDDDVTGLVDVRNSMELGDTTLPDCRTMGPAHILVSEDFGPSAGCPGNLPDCSPTRTRSIEDDRRTEDLIKEIKSGPLNNNLHA
ncbi:hypothetical protein PIB30_013308 [Stylosanthes scabra]|uniref:DUF4283 domain-containing protein n=1 Tax=Stylosanthes scabra TaxID=79078 RepID=A0ABU6T6P4_9FABA|nr:hypothetical protein [Stylosanthes scabra]